jgi:hypothetical protein
VTQIELLPCPFCGSPCHMRESDGGVIPECYSGCFSMSTWYETTERAARDWNRRTASPTRSDTREQAAASPSAVGEGQVTDAMVERALRISRLLGYDSPESVIGPNDMRYILKAALSSQAPKPASAGGAEACLAAAMVEGIDEAIANGDIERIRDIWNRRLGAIAAEANTAKEEVT